MHLRTLCLPDAFMCMDQLLIYSFVFTVGIAREMMDSCGLEQYTLYIS